MTEDQHIFEETATANTNSKEGYELPYSPSGDSRVDTMLEFAEVNPGEMVVDLGAGEGKLVVAFAQAGAIVDGFEIDLPRFRIANKNIQRFDLANRAHIYHTDFWDENLGLYDIILIYGITSIMPRLERKIMSEGKPGARIVSNFFTFPRLNPVRNDDDVYLYRIPPRFDF
jgi:protein-L-isoaspartate O-methyltransferase